MTRNPVPSPAAAASLGQTLRGGATNTRPRAPRVWFVDAMRLLASFQMVNGHTIGATMPEVVRQGSFYEGYLWFRGMIAVAFLMVAGIAFYLSTIYRIDQHRSDPNAVRRRFRRALFIIGIGYLLQLPPNPFSSDPELVRAGWKAFMTVGVLGCIGGTLLLLQGLTMLLRRAHQVVWAAGLLGVAIVALAPTMDLLLAKEQSHPLLNWVSHQGGSMFPLFPWAGYMLLGVALGRFMLPQGGSTPTRRSLLRVSVALAVSFVTSQIIHRFGDAFHHPEINHYATIPATSLNRMTAVLIFLTGLAVICAPIRSFPRFLRILAAETLTIYAFHLIVLFGPILHIGWRLERKLSLPQSLLLSAFMLILTASVALAWHAIKKEGWRSFFRRTSNRLRLRD